jgi:hypothetical protein
MVSKMFKTTLMATLLMGAIAAPSMANSVLIGGNQINGVSPGQPTLGPVFFDAALGTNAVIYSYEVDLTVGNKMLTGDGFSLMQPLAGFVSGSEAFSPVGGYNFVLTDSGNGGSITGAYDGSIADPGADSFVMTQTMMGTLSFESTVGFDPNNPALINYLSTDDNQIFGASNTSGEAFLYGNKNGTPIPTPLPAGFGSGLTGLAVLGLAAMKLRRKAAV